MKNRIIYIFLALSLLAACGTGGDMSVQPPKHTQEPPVQTFPQETAQPQPTPPVSPTPQEEPSVLDSAEALDERGVLLAVPCETVENALMADIYPMDGGLLISRTSMGEEGSLLNLALFSLADGRIVAEAVFGGIEQAGLQVFGDRAALCDWADGRIWLLDSELQVKAQYDLDLNWSVLYLSADLTKAYSFEGAGGLWETRLESGERRSLLPGYGSVYASVAGENSAAFSCVELSEGLTRSGVLNLETGETELFPYEGVFTGALISGDTCFAQAFDSSSVYVIGRKDSPMSFSVDKGSLADLLAGPERILVTAYSGDGMKLSLYGVDGVFISGCSLEGAYSMSGPVWCGSLGGYFMAVTGADGSGRLLFWDISLPVAGESLVFEAYGESSVPTGGAVDAALYERAEKLSGRYGVKILIAELCGTTFGEYTLCPETDGEYISAALDAVEAALARFPEGFFDRLCYGVYRETEIWLTGALEKSEPEGAKGVSFGSSVGAARQEGTKNLIALDIRRPADNIKQTLYHEISHIVDKRLEFDAHIGTGSFSEEGWSALNPDGFEYYGRYSGLPLEVYYDGYEAWFIDAYSKTFATEDRARLFEYAMIGADWAFSASPGRRAKLEYYCQSIRESFANEAWPDLMPWEEVLH